jgi:nucleoid-associated protein YgaU
MLIRMEKAIFIAACCLFLTQCKPPDKTLDYDDDRNPYFKKAAKAAQDGDYVAAAAAYDAALRANPQISMAHYELGLIYADKLGDQIGAMYHFKKHLDLNPTSPKQQTAKAYLDSAQVKFAATLPDSPVQNAEAFAKLQADNQALARANEEASAKIAALEARLGNMAAPAVSSPAPAAVSPAPLNPAATSPSTTVAAAPAHVPNPEPEPAPPKAARIYTIQAGDSLWKISSKHYPGDVKAGIQRILDANRDVLGENKPLKIGVTITVP